MLWNATEPVIMKKKPVKEDGNFYSVKVVTTEKQGGREGGNCTN